MKKLVLGCALAAALVASLPAVSADAMHDETVAVSHTAMFAVPPLISALVAEYNFTHDYADATVSAPLGAATAGSEVPARVELAIVVATDLLLDYNDSDNHDAYAIEVGGWPSTG